MSGSSPAIVSGEDVDIMLREYDGLSALVISIAIDSTLPSAFHIMAILSSVDKRLKSGGPGSVLNLSIVAEDFSVDSVFIKLQDI